MKKVICLFLACALLMLCGCSKESDGPSNTTIQNQVPSSTVETHRHNFTEADCTTPKTCTECGQTRGEPLGHDPNQPVCSRCGYEDKSFIALADGTWQLDCLSDNARHLSVISLTFRDNGTAELQVRAYIALSEIAEELRDNYPEEFLYDYSGTIYAFGGSFVTIALDYTAEENVISCQSNMNASYNVAFTLERTSGTRLSLVFYEGEVSLLYWQIGDILVGTDK